MQYYVALLCFLIKQRTLQGIEPETSTLIEQVYQTSQDTCVLSSFLFNICRFQAHVLNSTVFHLIWSPLKCQRAHQRVSAPRSPPRCITKTCR